MLTKFRKVELNQWLDEALLLMELIGVTVFAAKTRSVKKKQAIFNTVETNSKSSIEIRAKKYAKIFLEEQGIKFDGPFSYAKRQDNKEEFWLNPQTFLVDVDWILVLNNQIESQLIIIEVPAKTFRIRNNTPDGFKVRKDKPNQIDLEINSATLLDERSKYDFNEYVKQRINY